MLCNSGDSCNNLETAFFCGVLHFRKGVLISPVSVYTDEGAFGAVSRDFLQSPDCRGGRPTSEGRHSDQNNIFRCNLTLGKIGFGIAQIDFDSVFTPLSAKNMGNLLCAAGELKMISTVFM